MNIEQMNALPGLHGDTFPFRGHVDFRGFTQDDYNHFSAGLFQKVPDRLSFGGDGQFSSSPCKWFGGRDRFEIALKTLLGMGLDCRCTFPRVELIGDEQDGYRRIINRWYAIYFELAS